MKLPVVSREVCETIFAEGNRDNDHHSKITAKIINEQPNLGKAVFMCSNQMVQEMKKVGIPEETAESIESGYLTICAFMYKALSNQVEVEELEEIFT